VAFLSEPWDVSVTASAKNSESHGHRSSIQLVGRRIVHENNICSGQNSISDRASHSQIIINVLVLHASSFKNGKSRSDCRFESLIETQSTRFVLEDTFDVA
jgi:hypothetical protein